MPCSDSDSIDLIYMRKVFEFIKSNGDKFDLSRVYAHGFSQNSIWSSVIGVCFGDQVRGIFLGASGMSIKGIKCYFQQYRLLMINLRLFTTF